MIPILMQFLRTYAVYITWPVAAVIGVVGYNIESFIGHPEPDKSREKSLVDARYERALEDDGSKDPTEPMKMPDIREPMFGRNERPRSS